ncbi:hypothetical protein [sulfur-oxidizing endosymbiont of Gigantopelta aegis]|uniref:hypothetical protein n=1 Tax=sulfur-oxidizing endosymbiont of Gigantopelta aegis TaxID=2794934 RepID=UPI0018DD6312|nr:hypothetical protein [sulfur-oxidizing endosymbiont of Gigantopelta aegis]
MSKVVQLQQFKQQQLKKKNKANTLCKSGFHQWKIIHAEQFDVKKGKLVTTYQCQHCAKIKTT